MYNYDTATPAIQTPTATASGEPTMAMLDEIHQQFIDVVRKGRGKRLKETPETFSGLFWNGARAIEMGLADEFGTVDSVAREVIKAEHVVDYTERESWPDQVLKKFGTAIGTAVMRQVVRPGLNVH